MLIAPDETTATMTCRAEIASRILGHLIANNAGFLGDLFDPRYLEFRLPGDNPPSDYSRKLREDHVRDDPPRYARVAVGMADALIRELNAPIRRCNLCGERNDESGSNHAGCEVIEKEGGPSQ